MLDTPFIATRLQAALAGLGLIAITTLAAGAGGYSLGHRSAQAEGATALANLKRDHALLMATAAGQALDEERELTATAHQLGFQLLQERARHAENTDQLKRRIARVTSQYRPAPDAPLQPVPQCVFTHGFVGVYNGAIGAAPVPPSIPAAGAADAADPAEALDAGVQQADILEHITDYGQRCRDIESQLNRLLDWHEGSKP